MHDYINMMLLSLKSVFCILCMISVGLFTILMIGLCLKIVSWVGIDINK